MSKQGRSRLTLACPRCKSADINERVGSYKYPSRYLCRDCRLQFDEPIERSVVPGNVSEWGKRLAQANPDDDWETILGGRDE